MRRYHSDNKNYNAILDAMAEIRHNQLNESYIYEGEHEDEEMAEEMDDEEAEAIAEMMDEALYEMDMEDDEDNLTEADGDRKQRRRNRLRQALLIGAGLAAAGLGAGGAAYLRGRGINPASDIRRQAGFKSGLGGILQDIQTGAGAYGSDAKRYAQSAGDYTSQQLANLGTSVDKLLRKPGQMMQRRAINKGAIDDFNMTNTRYGNEFSTRKPKGNYAGGTYD